MAITPSTLTRAAGVSAVAAGAIFIGVQLNHPQLDVASVTTTEFEVRSCLKVAMAALALPGITGLYLHQVKRMGVLGLVGYVLFAANYLVILATSFIAATVLPSIAATSPAYVRDVLAAASGGQAAGDIGLLKTVLLVESVLYLAGGLIFGIALYRARVLPRWAAALLAAGGLVSAGLSLLPDPFFRLLAFPNGIAMVVLGYSLWRSARVAAQPTTVDTPHVAAAGAR